MNNGHKRAIREIRKSIKELELDLSGYVVLTEVGSASYQYMPVIAAMANAAEVFAWTKDSSYGQAKEIAKTNQEILLSAGLAGRVSYALNDRPASHIAAADIITNSGFVRPLDASLLSQVKQGCVIPLMFEAWEVRDTDIDIAYCQNNQIKVAGTNESFASIRVFDYVRVLAIKLMLNAGLEIMGNKIVVWSDDHFGEEAKAAFENTGAREVILTNSLDRLDAEITDADAVFICDYSESSTLIGDNGMFNLEAYRNINPGLVFVHLYGDIDPFYAEKFDLKVYPQKKGYPQVMTETLAYAGLLPVIKLQVAGLKVAQEVLQQKCSGLCQPITF